VSKAAAASKPNHPHYLVHSPKDNVGVVVIEGLKAGTEMDGTITETEMDVTLASKNDIPIGHKIALVDLKAARHRHQVRRRYRQDRQGRQKGRARPYPEHENQALVRRAALSVGSSVCATQHCATSRGRWVAQDGLTQPTDLPCLAV
jgi:hypothetical protein